MKKRLIVAKAAACACLVFGLARTADAIPSVHFDLRVKDTGGKEALLRNVGDSVDLNLYAILDDGWPGDDFIQSAFGTFQSSNGGLKGDLLGLRPPVPYNTSWASGKQQDLDGDGDLDVGSNNPSLPDDYYWFRTASEPEEFVSEYFVGRVRFTLQEALEAETSINFTLRSAYQGLLAWWAGHGYPTSNDGSTRVTYGQSVVIRSSVDLPGDVDYLHGILNTHVSISRPTEVTPGQSLQFNQGFDITATGSLTGGNGTVVDHSSGNFGGELRFGGLNVNGTFTQAAGYSRFLGVNVGPGGLLLINDGQFESNEIQITSSGLVQQNGGVATASSLIVSGTHEMVGGEMTVTGEFSLEDGGTVVVKGGTLNIDTLPQGPETSLIRIEGGRLSASYLDEQFPGRIEQTGGTFEPSPGFDIGGTPAAPSRYRFTGGTLAGSSVSVLRGDLGTAEFTQVGGLITASTGLFVFGGPVQDPVHYTMQAGEIDTRYLTVGTRRPLYTPGDGSPGAFTQIGGHVRADELVVGPIANYEMSGGALTVRKTFIMQGTLDLNGAAVPVTLGRNTFGDFTTGTIIGAENATFYGERGSLMSFRAGFDPLTQIGSIQTQGLVHVAGQPLAIPAGKSVGGSGTIHGDVMNDGLLAPGSSPGTIVVEGNYTQSAGGGMLMEIAGTLPEEFDLLDVTGTASLAGTLEIALLDDFVPSGSDDFTILTASSVTGQFANAASYIEFAGGRFDVMYSPSSVTLTNFSSVPEPGAAMALAAAGVFWLGRARRLPLLDA